MEKAVRVRFAPSPTGALHIGGVRTALYNYLFARKHKGTFVLRVEDTDQTRFVKGAEEYIFEALEWLGISPDESPINPQEAFAPYRQSERKSMYREYAEALVAEGKAYYAFDTSEELEAMRKRLEAAKSKNPSYNAITRMQMKNSLTLPEDEVKKRLDAGENYVIRIKIPRKEEIRLNDIVRGWVMVHSSALDDKVILKADGMPTYHLANVVDDYLMKISHVIRGEEWLPSAPLHVLLYQYLGWEKEMPRFAHLPLLLNPDAKGKLSKRKATEYGFPVFPLNWEDKDSDEKMEGFREEGYLPDALFNFLALLGWNPGTQQEIFTKEELIETFSLERVSKSGIKFDHKKVKWFNQQYLREQPDKTLAEYLQKGLVENKVVESPISQEKAIKISALMKERATFPDDIWKEAKYLFIAPETYDEKTVRKKWNNDVVALIEELKAIFEKNESDWTAENTKSIIHQFLEEKNIKFGKIMPAVRVAITGVGAGPDLSEVMEIIGKESCLNRIEKAIEVLSNKVNS